MLLWKRGKIFPDQDDVDMSQGLKLVFITHQMVLKVVCWCLFDEESQRLGKVLNFFYLASPGFPLYTGNKIRIVPHIMYKYNKLHLKNDQP